MTEFTNIIFGNNQMREATDEERKQIIKLVDTCPVAVFQILNLAMNAQGFCIGISALEENGNKG